MKEPIFDRRLVISSWCCRTYTHIAGAGIPQGFSDAKLLDDLRFAVCHVLCTSVKPVDSRLGEPHPYLDKILKPRNIVITSNWDFLLERACVRRGVRYRLGWAADNNALTILKLHGSVDWTTEGKCKKSISKANYGNLVDLIGGSGAKQTTLANKDVVRCKAVDNWTKAYQQIKAATTQPLLVTMARGKADDIQPLTKLWEDSYHALSRASEVHIVGYSLPDDDLEIRTLLRAGVVRGIKKPKVYIVNPAPDVHYRVRQQVFDKPSSDYSSVPGIG